MDTFVELVATYGVAGVVGALCLALLWGAYKFFDTRFAQLGGRIDGVESRLGERLDKMEVRLGKLEEKVTSIDNWLSRLEEREGINKERIDKVEERLREHDGRLVRVEPYPAADRQGYGRAAMSGA